MELLSFDIEIAEEVTLAPGEDLDKYGPFHITVAAIAFEAIERHRWGTIWVSTDPETLLPMPTMSPVQTQSLLHTLSCAQKEEGFDLCAWNGLGFDLRWIGWNALDPISAALVALDHYDPMFQFFCQRGFPISLAAVAKGMGIEQEKLMSGADAPAAWREGEFDLVKKYVMGDAQMTNQVVRAIIDAGEIRWISKKGKLLKEPMPRLKTVRECIAEPFTADQSWMPNPLKKEKFYAWFPKGIL